MLTISFPEQNHVGAPVWCGRAPKSAVVLAVVSGLPLGIYDPGSHRAAMKLTRVGLLFCALGSAVCHAAQQSQGDRTITQVVRLLQDRASGREASRADCRRVRAYHT